MALALDRTRMIPSLLHRVDRIIDFDLFVMMAIREAIKEKVSRASVPHAPYVSTAREVQRHPSSEHICIITIFEIYKHRNTYTAINGPNHILIMY